MRVVGGTARGRTLLTVPGDGTRPILDRVKTALFDRLRPRIDGMVLLDLFAGSGSVGIEALSQGAAHCTFLDVGHQAIQTIRKNLEATGFSQQATVRRTDALTFLRGCADRFDLIYVAPPQYRKLWIEAMEQIDARPELLALDPLLALEDRQPGLVIVQIDPREYEPRAWNRLEELRQARYGNTLLVFHQLRDERPGGEPEQIATSEA